MVSSGPTSGPPLRSDAGGQLLQELEALSQALYKAGHTFGPPANKKDVGRKKDTADEAEDRGRPEQQRSWHSQEYGRQLPDVSKWIDVTNFPKWLEDNRAFSQTLELPVEKKGFWNWKPFKALSNIGLQRINCEFSTHVHGIEGLPPSLNGLRLVVHLRQKESLVNTLPVRTFNGSVEFEETLIVRCPVYGSKKNSQTIKYKPKPFTLSVIALDVDDLEFGKHRLDLSRLLPETIGKGLLGEKSNDLTTSFKLAGKAKGSTLLVTFGYRVLDGKEFSDSDDLSGNSSHFGASPVQRALQSFNSLPSSPSTSTLRAQPSKVHISPPLSSLPGNGSVQEISMEHLSLDNTFVGSDSGDSATRPRRLLRVHSASDVLSKFELSKSGTFDDGDFVLAPHTPGQFETSMSVDANEPSSQLPHKDVHAVSEDEVDFDVIDQGLEMSNVGIKCQELMEPMADCERVPDNEDQLEATVNHRSLGAFTDMEFTLEAEDYTEDILTMMRDVGKDSISVRKSEDSDDEVDLVTGEFLSMLEKGQSPPSISDSDLESPKALLLKQFKQEALLEGGFGLDFSLPSTPNMGKMNPSERSFPEPSLAIPEEYNTDWTKYEDLTAIMDAAESELQKATQTMRSKARAKMLEDAEAEALMQEWGLSEQAFEVSPYNTRAKFGKELVVSEAPSLAEGLGRMIYTRDGGSLRSMNPFHFQGQRGAGHLVMHVSKPVVVPAEMGSSALDILRRMASVGMNKMAVEAMLTMPLDDITGKSIHQIAYEGSNGTGQSYGAFGSGGKGKHLGLEYHKDGDMQNYPGSRGSDVMFGHDSSTGAAYERNRIGEINSRDAYTEFMSLEELAPMAMEKIEALAIEGLKIQADMTEEEAPYFVDALESKKAMHLIEGTEDPSDEGDGLMSMAISLDEWMRLDSGAFSEDDINQNTLSILASHNTAHNGMLSTWDNENEKGKGKQTSSPSGGFMGDTLTLGMLVQLRDPLRNFEPVGAPMMAFVQAERVVVPPRPKMWKRVSVAGNSEENDELLEDQQKPKFKITGVHVSGLKTSEDTKQKVWGNQKQQQSSSRWLIANGMGGKNPTKHPLLKSKTSSTTVPPPSFDQQSMPVPTPAPTPAPKAASINRPKESLWSISSRSQGAGKCVRNPDVGFGKSSKASNFRRK